MGQTGPVTTTPVTHLPTNLLEAFIPGYSLIANFLLEAFGFDVTLLVSICLLGFGLVTVGRYVAEHAKDVFKEHFTSYIILDDNDDIYDQMMDWIATQKVSKRSRRLIAKTTREDASDLDDDDCDDFEDGLYVNYSNLDAKIPPKFSPSFGTHYFYHKGNFFSFMRGQKQVLSSGWGGSMIRDEEVVTLACVGRSTQPIKDLIAEARQTYFSKDYSRTCVRRAGAKEHRNRGKYWQKAAIRPSRPMHTVVLDHEEKARILNDINEYLHPTTKLWYAHRGIPYRRGYLFSGPPGTGKSSLAWAISGVFGLDIYCISLVDPTLTEEELGMMFTNLPHRCVVLLEDIDSAGLISRKMDESEGDKTSDDDPTKAAAKISAEISKAVQKSSDSNTEKKGITLSGLLNAIDGVASHEGRVLVMTTNCPEKLDDALIRPGRIDMQVKFTKATRVQIHELFTRMYSPDIATTGASKKNGADFTLGPVPHRKFDAGQQQQQATISKLPVFTSPNPPHQLPGTPGDMKSSYIHLTPPATPDRPATPMTSPASAPDKCSNDNASTCKGGDMDANLETIATRFAGSLPEDTFTPAEIQGFLLTRKKEPLRALAEVEAWRDVTIAAKEKKAKATKGI